MKLLCTPILKEQLLDPMNIKYEIEDTVEIHGWDYVEENHIFYLQKVQANQIQNQHVNDQQAENESASFLVISMTDDDLWEVDKIQSCTSLKKQSVKVENHQLIEVEESDYFIYKKRSDNDELHQVNTIDDFKRYKDKDLQLNKCDLFLLIPGKLDSHQNAWNQIPSINSDIFNHFKQNINACIENEYNSNFVNEIERKCIGEITLEITEVLSKEKYYQTALVGIVKHTTGFCILEIFVENCAIGGNKILNYYCGNQLKVIWNNQSYSIDEFQGLLNIERCGKKRSMVFAYDQVSEEEIINALANEELPMGKIAGDFERIVREQNIAQYDTAKVYVSEETMIEVCKNVDNCVERRMEYQTIELFFIELILFQDASIDKIFVDLHKEEVKQMNLQNIQSSIERLEQISFDMAQNLKCFNYEQFLFPTVRASAKRVAKGFGIDEIFEKYETNKKLLEAMINSNNRKVMKIQDKIKNKFLTLISALAIIGTLGEIIYVFYQDKIGGVISYTVATAFVVLGWCIYNVSLVIHKKVDAYLNSKKREI